MKKIQVLGPGCPNCLKLAEMTEAVARELGLEFELEKVTSMMRFAEYGVMATPALVVDGEVRVSGRVPRREELEGMLR
jgi:small redox-active disulfide protein 2